MRMYRIFFHQFDWLSYFKNLVKDIEYFPSNEDVVLVESQTVLKHIITVIKTTDKQYVRIGECFFFVGPCLNH